MNLNGKKSIQSVCCFVLSALLILFAADARALAPVISPIDDQFFNEDTALVVTFTVNKDNNPFPSPNPPPAEPIEITVASSNRALIPDENIVHTSSGTDHTLTITPKANQNGESTIFVTADNGSSTSMESFMVTVAAVNDAPVLTVPQAQTLNESTELVFGAAAQNPITAADIDAGDNKVDLTVTAGHGILKIPDFPHSSLTGNSTSELRLYGTLTQINADLDGMSYIPNPGWSGSETLALVLNDKGFSGITQGGTFPYWGVLIDTKNIAITVVSINDPMTLHWPQQVQTTEEDVPIAFTQENGNGISITDGDGEFADFDALLETGEGTLSVPPVSGLTVVQESPQAIHMTGTVSKINTALAGLIYTPMENWSGQDSLNITVTDTAHSETKEGETPIQVTSENDSPVLNTQGDIRFSPILKNEQNSTGNIVGGLIQNRITDADAPQIPPGIAAISAETENGQWEYSLDNGSNWTAFPQDLSAEKGVVLGAEARIRFVPKTDWIGTAVINFRAWDRSDGRQSGDHPVDARQTGGKTPFSAQTGQASIQVTDLPVTPVVTVDAGADQTVNEGIVVTLNGSASVVPQTIQITKTWTQKAGTPVTLSDIHSLTPTFTAPEVGETGEELRFELAAGDGQGHSASDFTLVRVKNVSGSVVIAANAGPDQDANEGVEVTLDGSASVYPANGGIVFTWNQISGPAVALSDIHAIKPRFTAPQVDTATPLVFQLTLSNDRNQSDTDMVRIRVRDVPVSDSIDANAGPDQEVAEGSIVRLNGTGSHIPAGTVPLYRWEQVSGQSVILSTPNSAETTYTAPYLNTGTRIVQQFKLTVSDNAGQSDTDTVDVAVIHTPANIPPIANAGPDQSLKGGVMGTLDGSGSSDNDGQIVAYHWESLTETVALGSPDAAKTTFTTPSGGTSGKTLEFKLLVTDNAGSKGSDTVKVFVLPDEIPPGPGMGDSVQNVQEGSTVILDGSTVSDSASVSAYSWKQTSGTAVVLSDTGAQKPTFVTPPVGTAGTALEFQLTVKYSNGQESVKKYGVNIKDNGITGFPDTVLTFKPTTTTVMGIALDGNGALVNLAPVDAVAITDPRNRPETLPYGLMEMRIKTTSPGATVKATFYLPSAAPAGHLWYKYNPTDGWVDYSAQTVVSTDRMRFTLTLTDGWVGDDDRSVNGFIKDPSGLGKPAGTQTSTSTSTSTGTGTVISGGGAGDTNGGGCFIQSIMF